MKTRKGTKTSVPSQPIQAQSLTSTQTTTSFGATLQKDQSDSAGSSSGKDFSSEGDSTTGNYKKGRKSGKVQVDADKTSGIIVSHRFKNGVVNFFINSEQRPETDVVGGGQGDHTTAYTAIIQAILSSTGSIGIESAIESLKEFGQLVLKGNSKNRFCAITKPEVHPDGFRDKVKKALKLAEIAKIITWKEIGFISRGLKDNKVNKLSEYLCDLTTCFLEEIQQSQAAYYSKGRTDKDTNEGNIVKGAARALLALDKLCRLCDLEDDAKFEQELSGFLSSLAPKKKRDDSTEEDHVIRYGFNILNREVIMPTGNDEADKKNNTDATNNATKKTEEFAKKLKDAKTIAAQRTILERILDQLLLDPAKIAGFMGDLFDYKREIIFDLKEAVSLTKTQKAKLSKQEKVEFRQEAIQKCFPKHDDYDFTFEQDDEGNDIVKITRKDDKKLTNVIDKHFKITWAAFPNLETCLAYSQVQPTTKKDQVENSFLADEVLEKQGWKDGRYEDKITYLDEPLTTNYLKQEILEVNQKLQAGQGGGR